MGESEREHTIKMETIEVPDERSDALALREEVRSILVRLLVKLYVERHPELVKDAA